MLKDLNLPFIAALLSSGLFILVFMSGLGILFMFVPTVGFVLLFVPILPILAIGLSRQPRMALTASLIATAMIGVIGGVSYAITFLLFFSLPAWYITRKSMIWRTASDGSREWMPVGLIFTDLTLWACGLVAFATLCYVDQPGGMPQLLAQSIHESISEPGGEYSDAVNAVASQWSFLIFPLAIWLWVMVLYVHTWLTNLILQRNGLQQRPGFAIETFPMPAWMLSLMAIAALASLIGSVSMSFLGQSTLITLMLPYFFLGSAIIHKMSITWPNRRFFLFLIYFMVFAEYWPAPIISGIGLWHHIKHLSASGTSYKS